LQWELPIPENSKVDITIGAIGGLAIGGLAILYGLEGEQKKICVSDVHFAVLLNRTSFHQTWVRARFKDSFPIFTAMSPLSQKHVKNRRFIDRFLTVPTKLQVSTSVAVDDVYSKNKEHVHEIQCICNDMQNTNRLISYVLYIETTSMQK